MPTEAVTAVQPQPNVLLIDVLKRTLDDTVVSRLVEDVHSAAAAHPAVPIVLDFSKVRFAPSVALGSLMQMSKSFQLDNRRLALIGVHTKIRDSMQIIRLDKLIEIADSIDQLNPPNS